VRSEGQALSAALVAELESLRRAAGMSHEELGRRAGVHRTTIGLIMSGKRGLTIETAGAISMALETRLSGVAARAEAVVQAATPRP
jgi:DNA-binding XRE family transcriptional regulator